MADVCACIDADMFVDHAVRANLDAFGNSRVRMHDGGRVHAHVRSTLWLAIDDGWLQFSNSTH